MPYSDIQSSRQESNPRVTIPPATQARLSRAYCSLRRIIDLEKLRKEVNSLDFNWNQMIKSYTAS